MNRRVTAAQVIFQSKLGERLPNSVTHAAVFSRWLRHTEDEDKIWLLTDKELDNIHAYVETNIGATTKPEILCQLIPNTSFVLQQWMTPNVTARVKFENKYIVYRPSAIVPDRVVLGSLDVVSERGSITIIENYKVTDAGPRSGEYHSEGGFVQSTEGVLYMLSKFENGDLQAAIFTTIYKSGSGENKIITMSGSVMGTMLNKPYAARIYCEAGSIDEVHLRTVAIEELQPHIQTALTQGFDMSPLDVVRFK